MKKTLTPVAAFAAALSVGAATASASVSAVDVEQMIGSQLGAQADAVECPGDLASDIGASVTCAVTRGDEIRGVTATVASVDNGQVQISLELARQ